MKVDLYVLLVIIGCAIVTVLPRIVPFVLVRNIQFPKPFLQWLSYIPVCLLTALVIQGVIEDTGAGSLPTIHWINLAAALPTLGVAYKTKSLLGTVITGVATVAIIQWIM